MKRLWAALAAAVLLSGASLAEDLSQADLIEEVDLPEAGETLLATDVEYFTPNEINGHQCDHLPCFWNLPMGQMDEEAIWKVLTQPVTVLKGAQREQIRVRKDPDTSCEEYTGVVTCSSQCVHVLDRGEEWTLIEAYSSCEEGSAVKVWALPFRGYVRTSLLEDKEVDQTYGLVIDKLQQRLYVFKEGKLLSTLLCSTGFPRSDTPFAETPAGEFLIVSWTGGFWAGELFCDMGMRINSGILIHEVPCLFETNKETGAEERNYRRCERYLGEKASHGCIRVQRRSTPEGISISWLWKNLHKSPCTKVIIWDEIGRVLDYPDDELELYWNPNGGKMYHSQPTCSEVKDKFEPMTAFTYGQLEDKPYKNLTRCPACAPQLRRSEIDTVNEKNNREAK